MKNNCLLLFLVLISNAVFSQNEEKTIMGQIVTQNEELVGEIEVFNISNERMTKTSLLGEFEILAKPNDVLVFSHPLFNYLRKKIHLSEYSSGKMNVTMTPKVTELDEVTVSKDDQVKLAGHQAKNYTPAERRLRAGNQQFRGNQGLEISNDAIINKVTGKSKQLKKEVKVEKKEDFLDSFDSYYSNEVYSEELGIEEHYIDGFKYFLAENDKFIETFYKGDLLAIDSLIIKLAEKYKQIIADEK